MGRTRLIRIFLLGALLVTLYLTLQTARESSSDAGAEVSVPVRSSMPVALSVVAPTTLAALPERRWQEDATGNPFDAKTWVAPLRTPVARPLPPKAPPVAYRYFGKMIEDGRLRAFLYQGDKVVVVSEGDTLGDSYRVEGIAPEVVTVTYLPLKVRQVIPLGEDMPEMRATESAAPNEVQAEENHSEKNPPAVVDAQAISGIQAMARQLASGMKAKGEDANNQ